MCLVSRIVSCIDVVIGELQEVLVWIMDIKLSGSKTYFCMVMMLKALSVSTSNYPID